MHRLTLLLLIPLLFLPAAGDNLGGRYAGEWKSNGSGGTGTFRMALDPRSDGTWKCDVSFTLGGDDIKTTVRTVKVDGSKLEVTYDFELQGNVLRSKVTGQWNGKAFEGQYETTTADGGTGVDDGTWTAAPAAG